MHPSWVNIREQPAKIDDLSDPRYTPMPSRITLSAAVARKLSSLLNGYHEYAKTWDLVHPGP
jgi:hypothetical protein